jgi:Fe-S-cluster containining protein
MKEEHAEKILFTWDEKFKFSCHNGLPCYNSCCRDVNIFLTPYDVLRMRRATSLPSEEFLNKHTIKFLGEEGLPILVLKMAEDGNKACHFVTPDGCGIYQDRPWSCRMFPVFPVSAEEQEFLIEKKTHCLGFGENKESTVREWKRDQGIDVYDKMNAIYKDITYHDFFQNGNKLDAGKTNLIYMACYDLDSFKKFLFGTKFFDIYDVDKDQIEAMKENEEELLRFGYTWVRFSLFSENLLKLKDKEMDKLLKSNSQESS